MKKAKKFFTPANICLIMAFIAGAMAFGMMFLWQMKLVVYPGLGSGSYTTQLDYRLVLFGDNSNRPEVFALLNPLYGNYLAVIGYIVLLICGGLALGGCFIKDKKVKLIYLLVTLGVFVVGAIFVFLTQIVWSAINEDVLTNFKKLLIVSFYPSYGPILGGVFGLIGAAFIGISLLLKK